jgi:hypothetical protein
VPGAKVTNGAMSIDAFASRPALAQAPTDHSKGVIGIDAFIDVETISRASEGHLRKSPERGPLSRGE